MPVTDHGLMAGARYVDPKILARIGNLELLARNVVEGFINGLHRAPYFGASIDFAEHRGYFVGACLAYLAQRQRDRVGLITFDNDIVSHVPPSAKHFNVVLHTMDRAKPE